MCLYPDVKRGDPLNECTWIWGNFHHEGCAQTNLHFHKKLLFDGLFAYFKFHVISHISAVARKWIIIILAKYLMFPLFERVYKQMRQQQFIARTIT